MSFESLNYLKTCLDIDYKNTKIYKIMENDLNKKYGIIRMIEVDMHGESPLVIIPGYSFNSFCNMFKIIYENKHILENKYSSLLILSFSDEIKNLSMASDKILDIKKRYDANEEFRVEIANIIDKILRNMELDSFDILGKSAGGGIATYIANKNPNVDNLYLCSPATNIYGENLLNFNGDIKLSWNKDDSIIKKEEIQKFIDKLNSKQKFKYYEYEKGGHELNSHFIDDIANHKAKVEIKSKKFKRKIKKLS